MGTARGSRDDSLMLDVPEGFDPFAPLKPQPFGIGAQRRLQVALYTDAHVIRGTIETRMRRLSDVLNEPDHDFVVVSDAVMEEFGAKGQPVTRADFAQVNLKSLLFAVTDSIVEPQPELRLVKSPENALVVVPPFKIVGRIHVLPDRTLRDALQHLTGRFIAVTDAWYWSDALREPKVSASFIAFNHDRAHVLASHRDADPWAGIGAAPTNS
jgi:hypothetical protein